jgi:hypothetical protein
MQALAREMNLSETSFVLTPTDTGCAAGAAYRMRIFTPARELAFAGHPSVGTAWVLADEGRIPLRATASAIRHRREQGGEVSWFMTWAWRTGPWRRGPRRSRRAKPGATTRRGSLPVTLLFIIAAALVIVVARGGFQ